MIVSILKVIITATLLGIPLAIMNALWYQGKEVKEIGHLLTRAVFTIVSAFVFSLIITHLTMTLKSEQGTMEWLFYALGLFFCIPYHLKSQLKENNEYDHIMDLLGIIASIAAYATTLALWASFFSNPYKAGFLHEISSVIKSL